MNKLIEKEKRIVVMSLRLPVVKTTHSNGKIVWMKTVGGMASALEQSLKISANRNNPALWLGWLGDYENSFQPLVKTKHFHILSVGIPKEEFKNYYKHFSNTVIWPAFHNFDEMISKNKEKIEKGWKDYVSVNKRFANEYLKVAQKNDRLIVHDYQLTQVAKNLKTKGFKNSITYFLHIPFPKPQTFFKMPHAKDLLLALLSYNQIAFQTEKDMKNFEACANFLNANIALPQLAVNPISIDPKGFVKIAAEPHVQELSKQIKNKYKGQKIIFSAGRLDYTKGFVESVKAFKKTLMQNPKLIEKTVFLIAAAKSRESIPSYRKYAKRLEAEIAKINKQFKPKKYQPVINLGGLPQEQVVAHYISCDVYLAGSLADGMNLTALEATAVCNEKNGMPTILVGKGAGVSRQLTGAITFDAKNLKDQSNAILQALKMGTFERIARMKANKASLRANTIENWTQHLLNFETYKPYPKNLKTPKVILRKNLDKLHPQLKPARSNHKFSW